MISRNQTSVPVAKALLNAASVSACSPIENQCLYFPRWASTLTVGPSSRIRAFTVSILKQLWCRVQQMRVQCVQLFF